MSLSNPERLELDELALFAWEEYKKGNKDIVNDIYDEILPFCLRISSKTCGRYIYEDDEETSIARLALLETFERYDPSKGDFLLYLAQVIKNRIIDYKRKEKKSRVISLSVFNLERKFTGDLIDEKLVEDIIEDLCRAQQIEQFKNLLEEYNIQLEDLIKSNPKQSKTRELSKEIATIITEDIELKTYLLNKKMLPLKLLETKYGYNRKLIDRFRKYIIANAIVILYNLSALKPYVTPGKGGKR